MMALGSVVTAFSAAATWRVDFVHRHMGIGGTDAAMHEQRAVKQHDRRIAQDPAADLAVGSPGDAVLDAAQRRGGIPGLPDRLIGNAGIMRAVGRDDRLLVGGIDGIAQLGRIGVGEGGIVGRRQHSADRRSCSWLRDCRPA